MAQAPYWSITTSSEQEKKRESVTDYMYYLAPWDTPLLTKVGMDSLPQPCINPTHQYVEKEERPNRSTLNGDINNSTTTIIITEKMFEASQHVVIGSEVILLGTTSDNLTFSTCTRSVDGGSAAAHSDLDPVVGYTVDVAQGAAVNSVGSRVLQPNVVTTYTQIFEKTVIVSNTSNVLGTYGQNMSTVLQQSEYQMSVIKKEIEVAMLHGVAQAPADTTTGGRFDGILQRAIANSTTTALSGASITQLNLESAIREILDYGGDPDTVYCGTYTASIIDSFGISHARTTMVDSLYGVHINKITLAGRTLNVLVNPDLSQNVFVLDTKPLGLGPLTGPGGNTELAAVPMGVDGNRTKYMITGELTFVCPMPKGNHVFTGAAFA